MAWTAPPTLTDGQVLTGAHTQIWRDDLLETAPAKATAAGQIFAATGANSIAARTPSTAAVSSADTTTSTTYTGTLTSNSGPTLTVTTGTSALVFVNARQTNGTASAECYSSFAISGATTLAASDNFALFFQPDSINRANRASAGLLVTGLTAGSNVFTMNYRVSAGTGTFSARQLVVIPF